MIDVHDFIAAAENPDERSPEDERVRHGQRGQHAQLSGTEFGACVEDRGALPDVLPGESDVDAGVAVAANDDALASKIRVFLPDDAVGTGGERRAGEDPGALTWVQGPGGEVACGDVLDDAEPARSLLRGPANILGAGGIPVHG